MEYWKRLCPSHISIPSLRPSHHQTDGPPFSQHCRLAHSDTEGDYVVARQQSIPEGTRILQEDPFVYQLHPSLISHRCAGCLISLDGVKKLIPCRQSSCTWRLRYCSSICESDYWFKVHAYVCAFSVVAQNPALLLAFQMWTSGHPISLVSNLDQQTTDTYEKGASFMADLFRFSIHDPKTIQQDLVQYQAILRCNGFGIQRKWVSRGSVGMDTIATALYLQASKFNHSCHPNVLALFVDKTIQLRTLRPVTAGEPLCISYGPLAASMTLRQRQHHLRDRYFFTCGCQACQVVPDPSLPPTIDQVYLCPNCTYKRLVLKTSTCPQCHATIDWARILKIEGAIDRYEGDLEKVLQLQSSIYHDETLTLGKTYDQLARVHHLANRSVDAIYCCKKSLSIVQSVYGSTSPEAAEEMFKLCGLSATSGNRNSTKEWIKKTRALYRLLGLDQQLEDDMDELDAMDRFI